MFSFYPSAVCSRNWAPLIRTCSSPSLRLRAAVLSSKILIANGLASYVCAIMLFLGLSAGTCDAQVPASLPITQVGSVSGSALLTVTMTGAGISTAPVALTQGNAGVDFAVVAGGSCAAGTVYIVGRAVHRGGGVSTEVSGTAERRS